MMLRVIDRLVETLGISGRRFSRTALVLAAVTAASGAMAADATIDYKFKGGDDGAGPVGRLVAGEDADTLYGTTQQGGTNLMGTVFRLKRVNGTWKHKVLHNFAGGTDGAFPQGALTISNGVLYGTTTAGGFESGDCSGGCGTVFTLTLSDGTEKVIHSFKGTGQGREPRAGVIFNGGSLYGTTYSGVGATSSGTVYRLVPNAAKTKWTFAALYVFKGGADGFNPEAEVTFLAGDLYGLTARGGTLTGANTCSQNSNGCGTFFKLTKQTTLPWPHTVIYKFKSSNDGIEPSGPLTLKNNVFYGTTHRGGSANKGTVFSLTPNATKTTWTEKLIYQFKSAGTDGKDPQGVVFHGNDLVGSTSTDGTSKFGGTAFQLHPAGVNWTYTQLDRFTGGADGFQPSGRLLVSGEVAYGVTFSGGGAGDNGTVFELAL